MSSTIDAKQRWLIQKYYETIQTGTFDETDVLVLLILLRERGNSVREFADFIAHRNKDIGSVQRYLSDIASRLKSGTLAACDVHEIFTEDAIGRALNTALQENSQDFEPLDNTRINSVVVCIMSLLQDVRIMEGKKSEKELGALSLSVTSTRLRLWGSIKDSHKNRIAFIVLSAGYQDPSLASLAGDLEISRVVEVSCTNGMISLNQTADRLSIL